MLKTIERLHSMDKFQRIDGHVGVVKDPNAGAILSNDVDSFRAFKRRRIKEQEQESRIKHLENKLDNVESLLEKILDKL